MLAEVRAAVVISLVLIHACGGVQVTKPTTGTIVGLARDHDSGDPVSLAEIRIAAPGRTPSRTTTDAHGLYDLDHLAPGTYELVATFAGQPIHVRHVAVVAGQITTVDVTFTLGRPAPIDVDYRNTGNEIERYHPKGLAEAFGVIEGTVNDNETRTRVVGAVVTVGLGLSDDAQQTVSDDQGRFRFDQLPPGVYTVSAYYSVSGRGQIEVRRGGIRVAGAEAVVVPLWIEMTR